ncbi:MAG TPA: threonine--tRNA ligase [Myxococcota bacterium]|nr:threonine--tRNA ligase [Myxococcota bacterium]
MSAGDIQLELPDGTLVRVPSGTTSLEIARGIGAGLAKAALAGELAGKLVDLRAPLAAGGKFRVITARDPEGGHVIRHSAEHVMADAVKRLWPATQIDVGRSDHSEKFQYDFDIPVRITPDDLPRIEAEMAKIVAEDRPFVRETVSRDEARQLFTTLGEHLKVSRLGDIPEGEPITIFRDGDFVDLCRGPHVQRTGQIGAWKLTELAGSYWRGDEKNKMLQRIYGIAFKDPKELAQHLERIEIAKERDHRKLGAELELFQFHEWAQGSPFYLPKGLALYNALIEYVRGLYRVHGYEEVMCPQIFSAELYKTSGHYQNFAGDFFLFPGSEEGEELGVKPMNCPGHCLLFRSRKRSYRELPLRFAEFSRLHRNERTGSLHGLTRVRSMAQDDGHIYCAWEDIGVEIDRFMRLCHEVDRDLGFSGVATYVSTRPEKFIGKVEDWDRAERLLVEAVENNGKLAGIKRGEGAFYGPKIERHFQDVMGRWWQLGTIQVDTAMPGRFGLKYIGADGAEHEPAMLHRAVLGSLERFIAIYLEHTGGDFPVFLAPQQVAVLPVSDRQTAYAREVAEILRGAGVRAEADLRSETLNYRVRAAETHKIPYALVVGEREQASRSVSVRRRKSGAQEVMPLEQFEKNIQEEIRTRGIS